MTRSKSVSYKPVFYLSTFLSVAGFVCLALDITQVALIVIAGSIPALAITATLFATDIWFAAQYLHSRRIAASGTTFTKSSSAEPRKIHKRNSRIVFSLIFIFIALIVPVFDIVRFQAELYDARVHRNNDLESYAVDIFFCSGEVAAVLASSGYGQVLSMCRIQRARSMLSLILFLVGLVEVVSYWRSDIGTEDWVRRSSNNNDEDVSKSVDPVFAQV